LTGVIHFCYTVDMPTTKKRINISVSKDTERALKKLALRDDVPQATKAGELLRFALEIEEDIVFDRIASEREKKSRKYVSYGEHVWK